MPALYQNEGPNWKAQIDLWFKVPFNQTLAQLKSIVYLGVPKMTQRVYPCTQMASGQPQRMSSLHPKPMICFQRHAWHLKSKSSLRKEKSNETAHIRYSAMSGRGSLDGPDASSIPLPPSRPATQEPKDDVAKLIYHTGKFIL